MMLFHLAEPFMVLREDLEAGEKTSRWCLVEPKHHRDVVVLLWGVGGGGA